MSRAAAWAPAPRIPDLDTAIRQRTIDAMQVLDDFPEPVSTLLQVRGVDGIVRTVDATTFIEAYNAGKQVFASVQWRRDLRAESGECWDTHPQLGASVRCRLPAGHDPGVDDRGREYMHRDGGVRW